jgi:hypothetical protein
MISTVIEKLILLADGSAPVKPDLVADYDRGTAAKAVLGARLCLAL